MVLSPETVNAYKELLTNPQKHGLQFKPLHECFEEIEEVTPKHLLFEDFANYLQKPLPKVIFYIIMDELYFHLIDKDEKTNNLGYRLKLVAKP